MSTVNIKQELKSVWSQIVEINQQMGFLPIGDTLKAELEKRINPILPPCLGYIFKYDGFGQPTHIFYEEANKNNYIAV